MNERKICFISCVNDAYAYAECVSFIRALDIPSGFEIDFIAVEHARSMTEGYQSAMTQSDAKYKVYLHQDVLITHKNFISDIVRIFSDQPDLGLLGVVGSKDIPPNAIWWESMCRVGKVYDSHSGMMEMLQFQQIQDQVEFVASLDGLILITQYDIRWNTEHFDGWHFYDLSQCMEFRRAGYKVGVVRQDSPWCTHDCGVVNVRNGYEQYRQRFLGEYGKELFPKVSVLIPTYNRPMYFELALQSALQQTYPHIEIVIADDSTNDDTAAIMPPYLKQYAHIRYYKNEKNLGQFDNDLKLMSLAEGEYINFLMDDDLFHPQKIEKMMRYFIADMEESISLVTSHRQRIDKDGNLLEDIGSTRRYFKTDTIVDGRFFGSRVLGLEVNVIGEPTTVLFRKRHLTEPFGTFMSRKYICNVDLASWANLLAVGNMVYISESLSYFRSHIDQQLKSDWMFAAGTLDSAHLVAHASEKGLFANELEYRDHVEDVLKRIDIVLQSDEHSNIDLKEIVEYREILQNRLQFLPKKPLVSIVIPAYNRPGLLEEALKSAISQTYDNIEIIVSDDSTNDEVKEMIQPYLKKDPRITYIKNEVNLGRENFIQCYKLANGEYINFLMDDDLFHPQKIEKMLSYFLVDPEVKLVTSYRELIDDTGNKLPMHSYNRRLFESNTIIDGFALGNFVLSSLENTIGEPTTVLFRKKDIQYYGTYKDTDHEFNILIDLSVWIELMAQGKAVYIAEPLSCFRQHAGQTQANPIYLYYSISNWYNLIQDARRDGFLANIKDYKEALRRYLIHATDIINFYISRDLMHMIVDLKLENYIHAAFQEYLYATSE